MPKKNNLFIVFLFLIIISGCDAASVFIGPIVSGVIYWINGEAHQYYNYKASIIHNATIKSLKELDQNIKKDYYDNKTYYTLVDDNNRFSISIYNVDKNISRLNIRINFIGDKDFAELIYKKVDENICIIEFK
jgi:hypothetical protein